MNKHNRGFSLIELLVVIVIICILTTLIAHGIFGALETARSAACKNNIRQMVIASHMYANDNNGYLPPAYTRDYSSQGTTTWENYLWSYDSRAANDNKVHQCPSFKGNAMWDGDHYTGYNYNSSYLGGNYHIIKGNLDPNSPRSAKFSVIKDPATCAMFGDGQYESGANKFMRSPYPGPLDTDAGLALAGTQGFRHRRNTTNVGFVDGSVRALDECFTKSAAWGKVAKKCGFLSEDNSMYDYD